VASARRAGHRAAAQAILTTDTTTKEAAVSARLGGRVCRIGGMAKGAGMIAPSMATMLCVITTDARIERRLLAAVARQAVAASFNRISVDGDMSTNDTVFVLAGGRSGEVVRRNTPAARQFAAMVQAVMDRLAYLIVKDGEGATRLAKIQVRGARTPAQARRCARQIATSSLVRTMLVSGDPNVGRIAAAAGASGAWFNSDRLAIHLGGVPVVTNGVARKLGKDLARRVFASREVTIDVDLGAGSSSAQVLTCDLTEAYVRINAHYAT